MLASNIWIIIFAVIFASYLPGFRRLSWSIYAISAQLLLTRIASQFVPPVLVKGT